MTEIGFVGPGTMGAPMMANLVKAGHSVSAMGRSDASRRRIAAVGAIEVASLAGLASRSDIIMTMLPDTPDVLGVVLGPDGLLPHLMPGQMLIDLSTIVPEASRSIADGCAARGVEALDAPVSGAEQGAVDGTLSIMVGGDESAFNDALPVLRAMGSRVTLIGGPGSGQLAKAANQLIVACNIQAVAEAMLLLQSAGVAADKALDALAGGLAGSAVLERKRASMLAGDFRPGFRAELHNKDLRIMSATALAGRVALPLATAAAQLVAALDARGDGHLDHSALLKLTRELNGIASSAE